MARAFRQLRKRLPALALLMILLGGWAAVPLALVMPEPVTCGMECCEEDGVCCCVVSDLYYGTEEGHDEQAPSLAASEKTCPANCATSFSFAHHSLTQKALPERQRWEWVRQNELLTHQARVPYGLEVYRLSAPRAPPAFS